MRLKLVAEKPKAQRQGCTGCPQVTHTDTQRDKLIGIGSKHLGLVNGLVTGSTLGLQSQNEPAK